MVKIRSSGAFERRCSKKEEQRQFWGEVIAASSWFREGAAAWDFEKSSRE